MTQELFVRAMMVLITVLWAVLGVLLVYLWYIVRRG